MNIELNGRQLMVLSKIAGGDVPKQEDSHVPLVMKEGRLANIIFVLILRNNALSGLIITIFVQLHIVYHGDIQTLTEKSFTVN